MPDNLTRSLVPAAQYLRMLTCSPEFMPLVG
jgi:hypothetical protein